MLNVHVVHRLGALSFTAARNLLVVSVLISVAGCCDRLGDYRDRLMGITDSRIEVVTEVLNVSKNPLPLNWQGLHDKDILVLY